MLTSRLSTAATVLHVVWSTWMSVVPVWQKTPASTWQNSSWPGHYSFNVDDQQSALLSLSALADYVQLPAHPSSSTVPPPPSAVAFPPSFVYDSPSVLPAYTASTQVREVTRTSPRHFTGSRLPADIEVVGPKPALIDAYSQQKGGSTCFQTLSTNTYNCNTKFRYVDSRNERVISSMPIGC